MASKPKSISLDDESLEKLEVIKKKLAVAMPGHINDSQIIRIAINEYYLKIVKK